MKVFHCFGKWLPRTFSFLSRYINITPVGIQIHYIRNLSYEKGIYNRGAFSGKFHSMIKFIPMLEKEMTIELLETAINRNRLFLYFFFNLLIIQTVAF